MGENTEAVPQTDTGGLVEKTKASERKKFKEFGKKARRKISRCLTRLFFGKGGSQLKSSY